VRHRTTTSAKGTCSFARCPFWFWPSPPTLSIGIATSPEHGLTSAELLRGADKALYAAKAAGRNCIVKASVVAPAAAFNQTNAINTYVI
jgi:hypothetical protein